MNTRQSPADNDSIGRLEAHLSSFGHRIPASYVEFLRCSDGLFVDNDRGYVHLLGVDDLISQNDDLFTENWPTLLVIGNNGIGGEYCLSYGDQEGEPPVVLLDIDAPAIVTIKDSFVEFIIDLLI